MATSKDTEQKVKIEEIKLWLKQVKKDRYWLAKKCLVSKRTVDNWLSLVYEIPSSKLDKIESLMKENIDDSDTERSKVSYDDILTFTVRLTQEEWDELLKGVPVGNQKEAEEYVRKRLQRVVDETEVDIMSAKYDDPPSEEP